MLLKFSGQQEKICTRRKYYTYIHRAEKLFMWAFALNKWQPFHYSRNVYSYYFVSMLFTLSNISAKECVCHYCYKGTNSYNKVLLQIFGSE